MGFPLFKVTLSNDIEGSLVISEPGGWDEAKLKLERNEELSSLVEYYDQPLTFYGQDTAEDGGINFIRNIEQTQGPDAQITILIEVSHDEGETFEQVVDNTVEVETIKEMDFYKLDSGVIRNGFWQFFMNRRDTPVDLASLIDLDGEARTAITPVELLLTSQKMRVKFSAIYNQPFPLAQPADLQNSDDYVQFDWEQVTFDEIEDRFTLSVSTNTSLPVNFLSAKYGGDYAFDITIDISQLAPTTDFPSTFLDLFIKVNNDTPIAFSTQDFAPVPGSDWTRYTYNNTLTINAGDLVRVYGLKTDNTKHFGVNGQNRFSAGGEFGEYPFLNNISIVADTIYPDTSCEGFFIHEAGNSITDRIIGRDGTFYSEYLGNTQTQIKDYPEDGCGSAYAVTRGLNVRGYSLADKPFFMSFNTWWNGINPLLNLGLGYERIGSPEVEVLRIEPKSYFYNETPSVNFDFVNNIERSYDVNMIYKVIEIGFEKWSAESVSGVDDPQSKRVYNTRYKTIGKEVKILSKFIGASLAIEQTRRNRAEQGKDWRLDDDVIIIAMNLDGGPEFQPELDDNFSSITNLLNSETRYNIRLSVARNFERWQSYFNGCLQWYVSGGDEFSFASGEGNFDMTSTLDGADCEGSSPEVAINEKGNFEVTNDHLYMPVVYTFEHPLTWDEYKTIRDNRHQSIGVSRTDVNHKICFIKSLEYEITHGKATFVVNVKGSSSGYDPADVYFDSDL